MVLSSHWLSVQKSSGCLLCLEGVHTVLRMLGTYSCISACGIVLIEMSVSTSYSNLLGA